MFDKIIKKKSYKYVPGLPMEFARQGKIIPSGQIVLTAGRSKEKLGTTTLEVDSDSALSVGIPDSGDTVSDTRKPPEPIIDQAYIDGIVGEKLLLAREEFRREKDLAYNQGFEAGKKTGTEEGLATVKKVEDLMIGIREEIFLEFEKIKSEAEKVMAGLSLEIAEAVIGEAVMKSSRELLEYNLKRCLDALVGAGQVKIRINPADYDFARDNIKSFKNKDSDKFAFEFEPDVAISPGGCYIESRGGAIDGRIESQFELIKESFLQMV